MPRDADDARKPTAASLDLDEPEQGPTAATPDPGHLEALIRGSQEWWYVDQQGNIKARGGKFCEDLVVGKMHGEDTATILAALVLRFHELENRLAALQHETRGSRNPVRNLKSLTSFVRWVQGAEAIGDIDGLLERAHALIADLEQRTGTSRTTKLALVERAEELARANQWKNTAGAMEEVMEQWKQAGSVGREEDEALWERIRTARRTFFTRRTEHYNNLKRSRAAAREAKEALIERTDELAPSTDFETTFEAMQALMEDWKKAGSAGRDQDEVLWQRFRAARDPFFERRKAHFAEQRRQWNERPRRPERGDRGRGDRRPGSPARPPRGGAGERRGPSVARQGALHASLAEIVGPLKDLFPEQKQKQNKPATEDKGKNKSR